MSYSIAPSASRPARNHVSPWRVWRVLTLAVLAGVFAGSSTADAYHLSEEDGNVLLMQATQEEYVGFLGKYFPDFRVKYFNAEYFEPFDDVVYSAVFEPNPEGYGVSHQFGISWGVLTNQFAALTGVAEMMQVDSYDVGDGEVRYAYIAYHKPDPADWFAMADVNTNFVGQIENGLPSELKVINRTVAGPFNTMTALYKADNTHTFAPNISMFIDEFEDWYAAMSQVGYRLTSVEVNQGIGAFPNTYRPVFKSDGNLRFSTEKVGLDEGFDQASRDRNEFANMNAMFVALVDLGGGGGFYDDFPAFFVVWRGQAKFNPGVLSGGLSNTLAVESDPVETVDRRSTNVANISK